VIVDLKDSIGRGVSFQVVITTYYRGESRDLVGTITSSW
jgi:hypothetical protein